MSSSIKLDEALALSLPAAKQKDEEKTSEPCGLKHLMGARCLDVVDAVSTLLKSSFKLEMPLNCMDKEHSKN